MTLEFCQYKVPWRKRTRVLTTCRELEALEARCRGPVCSKSGTPNFTIEGKDDNGVFWTRRAEPYTPLMCKEAAAAIVKAQSLPPERCDQG